jgi:calcium-dependent protein kinase
MGCMANKREITVTSVKSKHTPRLNSYDTRMSFRLDCGTFVQEKEGNPYSEYDVLKFLGKGSFGKVSLVRNKATGKEYAMKVINKDLAYGFETNEREILKEINILKGLDHQNIIKIHEYFNTQRELFIISEVCKHGELFKKLIVDTYLSEAFVWKIMKQVFSAVAYCHSYNIIHRDLKPQNVLIYYQHDDDIMVKVIDFGTSEIFCKPLSPGCIGTIYYMAPEIVGMEKYDSKCDMWSCGVMMYYLLSGELPFVGYSEKEVYAKILRGKIHFSNPIWDTISQSAKDLIQQLLTRSPMRRISAHDALQHPWIRNRLKVISSKSVTSVFNNFNKFKVNQVLQHAALQYMVRNSKVTADFKEVRRKFSLMDVNKDGKLSFDELVACFGMIMDKEEATSYVNEFFKLSDTDDNGYIEFEEFLKVCLEKNTLLSENNLIHTFHLFDLNKDGKICAGDLQKVLGDVNINEGMWETIISLHDKDSDGMLAFSEFRDMMNQIKVN